MHDTCGTCDTAPHDTTVVRCRRMLAASAAGSRAGASGQHLRVLLLVLAQHLRHCDQGLDLGHLLADVHQLAQVRLTNMVNCCQVTCGIALNVKIFVKNIS